jgi:hypothetical protein
MASIQNNGNIDITRDREISFEKLRDFVDAREAMDCDPPTAHIIGIYDVYISDSAGEYPVIDFYIEVVCDFVKREGSQLNIVFTDYKSFRHTYPKDTENRSFHLKYLKGITKTKVFIDVDSMMDFLENKHAKLERRSAHPDTSHEYIAMFNQASNYQELYERIVSSQVNTDVTHTGLFNGVDIIEHNLNMYIGSRGINPFLRYFDLENFLPLPDGYKELIDTTSISKQAVTSIDQYLSTLSADEQVRIHNIRRTYSVIRSTIDFLHDFVGLAIQIQENFIWFIERYIGAEFIPVVNSIFRDVQTSGGNVNQNACKNLWSQYAINYRRELSIPFFPISEMGNLGSARIFKDETTRLEFTPEFDNICHTLRNLMGITHFYIEAQNTPLATAMVRQRFNIITDSAAARDAAPGYSIKTFVKEAIYYKRERYDAVTVNRDYTLQWPNDMPYIRQDSPTQITIVNGPNCLISKYLLAGGIYHLVNANNDTNDILSGVGIAEPFISVSKQNPKAKVQELGLNALLATAGLRQLRGSQSASPITDITILNGDQRTTGMLMLFLKTYTDYCQADTIEQIKANKRVIAASSDFLASRTFDAFFATPTFYVGVNNVTATCSDTRYMTPDADDIENKLLVFAKIQQYHPLIIAYINYYITRIQTYIATEYTATLSPAVYYAGTSLQLWLDQVKINAAQTIQLMQSTDISQLNNDDKISFIQQFPDSLSEYIMSLSKVNQLSQNFMETYNKSSEIIVSIMAISNRINIDELIDNFHKTKQSLINALPNDTPIEEINTHLISIYTAAIATKSSHAVESFLTNIMNILLHIQSLMENPRLSAEDQQLLMEVKESFKQIFVMVGFVHLLNNVVNTKLQKRIKEQFIAVNPSTFSENNVLSSITDDNLGPIESMPIETVDKGIKTVSELIQKPEDVEIPPSAESQEDVIEAVVEGVTKAQTHNNKVINYAKKQLLDDILKINQSQSQFVNDRDALPLYFSYIELVDVCKNISGIAPHFSERIDEFIVVNSRLPQPDRKTLHPTALIDPGALEAYSGDILVKMETQLLRGGKRNRYNRKTRNTKRNKKNSNKNTIRLYKSKRNTKRSRKTRKITKRAKYIKKNVTKHRR